MVESSIKPSRGFPKDSGATCDDKQQHASRRDNNYLKSQHQVRLDLLKQHRKRPHPDEVDDFQPRRLVVDQPKQAKSLDVPPDADLSLYYRTQLPSGSSPPFASSSSSSSHRTLEPPLSPYVKLEELDEPLLIKSPEQKQLLPQPQVDRYYRHTCYPLPPLKRCESPMQDSHLRSFSYTRQHQWREIFSPHMPGAKNSPPLSPDQAAPISKYRQDQENQAEISCQPQYDSFYEHEQTHKEPPKYFDSQRGHHTLYRHEQLLQRNDSQQPHDYQEEHQLSQWQYSVRASPTLYPLGTARAPSTSSSFDESGLSDFSDGILLKGSFLSKPPTIMSAQTSRKWIEEDIMSNSSSKSGQGCSLTPSENWTPEPSNSWHENPNGNTEAPIDYSMRNTAAAPHRDQEGKALMHGQKQASLEEMFEPDVGKERMDMKDNFSQGTFTNEELQLIDYVQKSRAHIIGKISDAYYDDTYREELTALLVSRGSIRPSFQFLETINKSIMESSVEVIKDILDLFNIAESLQRLLLAENVSFTCLVGSAVNIYGNNAQTFAEQAELSGIVSSKYVQWLEENNLTDIVPRLEIHYLNPSPWSEQEVSEVEFHDVLKKVIYQS